MRAVTQLKTIKNSMSCCRLIFYTGSLFTGYFASFYHFTEPNLSNVALDAEGGLLAGVLF